ncbi:MAG: hypothetical protein J5776_03860 [Clostridiales bacterium]|nr:hypothetical protein [Clostridiales bacterium]
MIGKLRPDQAERVLCEQTYDTPDDKVMNKIWIKNFVLTGVFLILAVVVVAMRPENNISWFCMCCMLAFTIMVISKFVKARVVMPKRFKASIKRYGRENLLSQMVQEDTDAFFFDPAGENTENITVLTRDYFIIAREDVIAIDEIRSIFFSKRGYNDRSVEKFEDEYTREVLRNIYMMDMTYMNGKHRKAFVAVPGEHIDAFIAGLNNRTGDDRFRLL